MSRFHQRSKKRVSNENHLPARARPCDTAPTPTAVAEIVSDDFPVLHAGRILLGLVSTQQQQSDMKGRNDAGDDSSILNFPPIANGKLRSQADW
jgi:hypothetical protein